MAIDNQRILAVVTREMAALTEAVESDEHDAVEHAQALIFLLYGLIDHLDKPAWSRR